MSELASGPVLAEWEATALSFGVAIEQVRRDHLISHVLAAISRAVSVEHCVRAGPQPRVGPLVA